MIEMAIKPYLTRLVKVVTLSMSEITGLFIEGLVTYSLRNTSLLQDQITHSTWLNVGVCCYSISQWLDNYSEIQNIQKSRVENEH